MLLIVGQPSARAGWCDAVLALQDLAEAIYIVPKVTLSNNFYSWKRVWGEAFYQWC